MTDLINGRMPEEIKAAFKHCIEPVPYGCEVCPYNETCLEHAPEIDAIALIERLESERDEALAKVPKWISVDDKDPEFPCITYDGENPPKIPHEIHTLINGDGEKRHFSYDPFEMEKFFRDQGQDVDMFSMTHITHWMPVPERPEDGGKQ